MDEILSLNRTSPAWRPCVLVTIILDDASGETKEILQRLSKGRPQ